MSDTGAGGRLDSLISEVEQAVANLKAQLQPKLQELGDAVSQAVDAVEAKIAELRAARQGGETTQ